MSQKLELEKKYKIVLSGEKPPESPSDILFGINTQILAATQVISTSQPSPQTTTQHYLTNPETKEWRRLQVEEDGRVIDIHKKPIKNEGIQANREVTRELEGSLEEIAKGLRHQGFTEHNSMTRWRTTSNWYVRPTTHPDTHLEYEAAFDMLGLKTPKHYQLEIEFLRACSPDEIPEEAITQSIIGLDPLILSCKGLHIFGGNSRHTIENITQTNTPKWKIAKSLKKS